MIDVVGSEPGTYLLTFIVAVGVGLIPTRRTSRGWVAVALITVAVVALAFALGARAPWIAPIYVVVYAITGIMIEAHELAENPVVGHESYVRRILRAVAGGSTLRAAEAAAEREDAVT